jgi:hypothetical protein
MLIANQSALSGQHGPVHLSGLINMAAMIVLVLIEKLILLLVRSTLA